MTQQQLAIIGGSGLYDLPGLTDVRSVSVSTPFGSPSGDIVCGEMDGMKMLFLARHGKGHFLSPSEVNYRANIFALKQLGATHLISISAVGSLREEIVPGELVVVRQYIDRTKGRPSTFFGNGIVGHVMFADPTCTELSNALLEGARSLGYTVHDGKVLMVMEGPAFSTRAESHLHRLMGADLIGMTSMPEAKLAREAELCYANLALATDYDCWHEAEEDVTLAAVLAIMKSNVEKARSVVAHVAKSLPHNETTCGCSTALEFAIVTDKSAVPADTRDKMKPIFGRYL